MNAIKTDLRPDLSGGNRGRAALYAVCLALILGLLLTLGSAGQVRGATTAECTDDSAPYRIDSGGSRQLLGTSQTVYCKDTNRAPSKYVNTTAGDSDNKTLVLKPDARAIDMSDPSIPAGTPEAIFRSERWDPASGDEMSWNFPVTPGTYEVRLYFAEIWSGKTTNTSCCQGVGQRVFDVKIEGDTVLDNYDVYAEVGGFKGIVKTFTTANNDSLLNIDFLHEAGGNNPSVKAIDILPAAEPGNQPSILEPIDPKSATEGKDFSLQLQASNPDGDTLTYSAQGLPAGLTVDANTGLISGMPALGTAAGSPYIVEARVFDGTDDDTENFSITVSPPPDSAKPVISGLKPSPGSKVRDRTPKIGAVVRDAGSNLAVTNIKLYVDGKARTFSYSDKMDTLAHASRKLSYGRHTVKVVATDRSGNQATKQWSFKVVKKRR